MPTVEDPGDLPFRDYGTDQPVPAAKRHTHERIEHEHTGFGHHVHEFLAPTAPAGLREALERLPRYGVVDGVPVVHPKGILVHRDAVLAAIASPSEEPGLDVLRRAAENVSDRRTSENGGFWVSRKEMRALDLALGRPDIGVAKEPES